ncbi:hypothetical protein ACJU26_07955 [Acidithiobacillus sp. M4-SHS-6]|uniref:hypothetical protein n=1 Tax=Acidithiobacillus sp. M4-SHS-6 TaxID=3383024 RepID=UPI0039BE4F87
MKEIDSLPLHNPSYGSAIIGGFNLLKRKYYSLAGSLLVLMMLFGVGFVIDLLLNRSLPSYIDLWRFPLTLWITMLDMGLFYILAKAIANNPWKIGNLFWAFHHQEAWVFAIIYSVIASILSIGLPTVTPGQKLPSDWLMHAHVLITLFILFFLEIFAGYILMLYSAYGVEIKKAATLSLQIFGKKWKWLLFPVVLSIIIFIAFLGVSIILGMLAALLAFVFKLSGLMPIGKIVLVIFFVAILVAIYITTFIWMYASMIIASGALMADEN